MVDDPALPANEGNSSARPAQGRGAQLVLACGLVVGILAVLVRIAAAPLGNTDTYFHLRFGEEFLHGWSLWHPGSVSTFATQSWVPTQWLPEVVMAKLEESFGLAGVAWLFGVQLVSLALGLYLTARRWVSPLIAGVLVTVALVASSTGLSMRPQTWSFLLVSVTTAAWFRTREDGRLRWWLIPLTWLWAMVHGMWPIGLGVGLVAAIAISLDRVEGRPPFGRSVMVSALSALAAAVTPVGPRLYGAVVGVGSRAKYFAEWGSPDFTRFSCIVLALLVAVAAVAMTRQGRRSWFDVAFLLLAGACAVWSWRTVPVSAMLLVPLVASQLAGTRPVPSLVPARRERILVASAGVVALGCLAAVVPHTADDPPPQPPWVDPAMRALPAGTKVLDEWDLGGYMMWRYPQLDLLMHGYGDTFTTAELQRNSDIEALAPGWDRQVRATGVRVALLRPTDPLAYALRHEYHWAVLHSSPVIEELAAPPRW